MRCDHSHDSGPYVLGALLPPEREAFERHLAECVTCRTEVADLAALPGLLGRLDLPTAQAIAAGGEDAMHAILEAMPGIDAEAPWAGPTAWAGPTVWAGPTAWAGPTVVPADSEDKRDPLLPRLLARVKEQRRSERRRQRWQTVGAAFAAACLVLLAVVGIRVSGIGSPNPHLAAMREVVAGSPVTARVAVMSVSGGTRVHMHCSYKAGTGEGEWMFRLFAIPNAGDPQELRRWMAGEGDEYDLTGYTRLSRSEINRIEIRRSDGVPVLVYDLT